MSREIKFRGKRIDNSEWVCGHLIGTDVIVGEIVEWDSDYFCTEFWMKVDPETVGQDTGLKDRNGKEIYEDDIVSCDSSGVNHYENRVVCYDSIQARYKTVPLTAYHQNAGNGGWTGYELKYHNEIIGNIHENKELIQVE